ncbi:polysaccharide biosynthesis/export family protein [Arvimicrobium flavum]|uniref:polysaccharide biosynthesis/export family protein n=1 Tax=Arvimicrobium flavum TaxID=3393320 RepID=UPI00237B8C8C|nr:polysaccharide biosynthesis/export family protein [Mesorhizobium shangrilense]
MLTALALMTGTAWQASAAQSDYPLAPGDTVRVDILDDEKEPVDQTIALDGSIQAPFLGAVKVAGLSVEEALETLTRRYVDQSIFVAPKIGFSISAYRPIFVVGDVRQPGSYPYQARLSVEKAIGLAGGQLTTATIEDPVLARARLGGEIEAAEANVIREALAYARVTAELAGRSSILPEDIPASARAFVTGPLAESVLKVEQRIAKANTDSFTAQQAVLSEQIADAEKGLALLEELLKNVEKVIEIAQSDLKRTETLRKQGLNTQANISDRQRQLAQEEARQLQVLASLSNGRTNIGVLKSRLVELSQSRNVNALVDLQAHNVSLAAFLAEHRRAEEQLVLMTNLTAEKLSRNKQIVLDFTIRREGGDETVDIPATGNSMLAPGDVLVVRIRDTSAQEAVATLPLAVQ